MTEYSLIFLNAARLAAMAGCIAAVWLASVNYIRNRSPQLNNPRSHALTIILVFGGGLVTGLTNLIYKVFDLGLGESYVPRLGIICTWAFIYAGSAVYFMSHTKLKKTIVTAFLGWAVLALVISFAKVQ